MATPAWATGKRAKKGLTSASNTSLVSNASSENLSQAVGTALSPTPPAAAAGSPQEAPYLTHLQRFHGQITLSAPDNMGRRRQPEMEAKNTVMAAASTSKETLDEPPPLASGQQQQQQQPKQLKKKKAKKQVSANRIQPDIIQAVINAGRIDSPPQQQQLEPTANAHSNPRSLDQLRSTRVDVFQDLEIPSEPLPAFSSPSPRPGSSSDQSLTPERVPSPVPPDYAPRTPSPTSDLEQDDQVPDIVPKWSSRDLWDPMALAWDQDRENGLDLDERIKRDQERREAFEKVERLEREREQQSLQDRPANETTTVSARPLEALPEETASTPNRPATPVERKDEVDRIEQVEASDQVKALPSSSSQEASPGGRDRVPPPVPPSRRVARTNSVYGGRRFVEAAERRIAAAQARKAATRQTHDQESSDAHRSEQDLTSSGASAGPVDRRISMNSRRRIADAAERRMNVSRASPLETVRDEEIQQQQRHSEATISPSTAEPVTSSSDQGPPPLPRRPPWALLSSIPDTDRESLIKPLEPVRRAPSLPSLKVETSRSVPDSSTSAARHGSLDSLEQRPTRRPPKPLPIPPAPIPANRVDAYTAIRERAAALAALNGQAAPETAARFSSESVADSRRPSLGEMRRTASSTSSMLAVPTSSTIERPGSAASSFEQRPLAQDEVRSTPSARPDEYASSSEGGQTVRAASPAPVVRQYTDLDLLLARLERREGQGESSNNYDDLLVIGEVLGQGERQHEQRGTSLGDGGVVDRQGGCTNDEIESLAVARVELVRRRVDKQGRVKLKLSVVGVRCVDCGVCLSQFKVDEFAVVLPECMHIFHASCIQPWLRHHRTCPQCRAEVFPAALVDS